MTIETLDAGARAILTNNDRGGYTGYTGSFIGMAPAGDPELVVAVTVQRPTNGYYGGTVAAPVFQDVMSYALQSRRVPPTEPNPDTYPLYWGETAARKAAAPGGGGH